MFAELNNPPPSCFLLGINRPPDWEGGLNREFTVSFSYNLFKKKQAMKQSIAIYLNTSEGLILSISSRMKSSACFFFAPLSIAKFCAMSRGLSSSLLNIFFQFNFL